MTTDTEEIQKIIRSYYKSLHSTNVENLEKMDNFLDKYQVLKLNQDQKNYVNSPITPKKIEAIINRLTNKQTNKQKKQKTQEQMGSMQSYIRPSKKT